MSKNLTSLLTVTLLCFGTLIIRYPSFAQSKPPKSDNKVNRIAVIDALKKITQTFGTQFVYDRGQLEGKYTSYNMADIKSKPVEEVLKAILYPNDFVFLYVKNNYYTIVTKDNVGANSTSETSVDAVNGSSPNATLRSTIRGTVVDAITHLPLSGVSVSIKGTQIGGITDSSGAFAINTNSISNPVLVVSIVGYDAQEVKAAGKKNINISLNSSSSALGEVVVVGYGTARKRDLTTSIATLSSADIMKTPITSTEQALQGNAAGVLVTNTSSEPGGDITIRVRGGSSIKADNEPLLVIDGFTSDQGLSSLNPADIKSIEILKDAGATAIYGSRGANGVILVTTKSGVKGKPIVTFENYYGTQTLRRKLPLLNAAQLAQLSNEARETAGLSPNTLRPDTIQTTRDWQDLIFHTAPQYSSTLSVAGGDDKVRYYVSANYLKQQGLIVSSDYSKASLRSNLDLNLSKSVSAGVKLNLAQTVKHGIQVGDNGSILRANATNPTDKGLLDPSGSFYLDPVTGDPVSTSPLANAQETINEKKNLSVLVNGYVQFRVFKNITLRSNATMSPSYGLNNYYLPNTIKGDKVSDAYEQMFRYSKWSNDNTISYNGKIRNHSFSLLGGEEVTKSFTNNFKAEGLDYSTDVFQFYNLGSGNGAPLITSGASEYSLLSYFSRATYNYNDRYLFSFTYRADGSSKFGANNKWGYFPAGSVAWRVSNEPFLKKFKGASDIKFRASLGVNGSDRIDPYSSLSLYSTIPTGLGGALGTGYVINRMANADLKWEKTKELDLGIDFSILRNRISFTADYYEKNTSDLLLDFALPAASGYTTVAKNIGSVENKGLEFSLTSRNVVGKTFSWTTSFNAAINRNKVTDLGGPTSISAISNSSANTKFGNVVLIQVGQPLGVFYGYQTNGIFQTQQEVNATPAKLEGAKTQPGFIKYVDQNNDGVINEQDKVILGNPMPKWNGGLTNTFSYKGFDLSVFMIFQQGNSILNTSYTKLLDLNGTDNQLAKVLDRWRAASPLTGDPGNPSNTVPRAYSTGYTAAMSDLYIEDGSYLRIKTISLSYRLNNASLYSVKLPSLRFYVTGTNLITYTKYYGGYDPEVSYLGKQSVGAGIDNGSYPTSKMIVFGINATF
jgi:TonB-dependent starch-binding outer membrane protein SusC